MAGPMKAELAATAEHDKFWRRRNSHPRGWHSVTDKSVPNLSSIVVLASPRTKKMLLTGDAPGRQDLEGLPRR